MSPYFMNKAWQESILCLTGITGILATFEAWALINSLWRRINALFVVLFAGNLTKSFARKPNFPRVSLPHRLNPSFVYLQQACKKGHKNVVEVFLRHGVDTKAQSTHELTAKQIALKNKHFEIQNLLADHEAR